MASTFYIVHHEFKAGKAEKWWETAYAAMSPGGGWKPWLYLETLIYRYFSYFSSN